PPGDASHESLFGPPIHGGDREVRLAGPDEIPAVLALRARAFRGGKADRDNFDATSLHLWVGRPAGAAGEGPQATLRLRRHTDARALLQGYAAQHYDLTAMSAAGGTTLELGRLCAEPGAGEADLLRLLWAGVARVALVTGAARLIGCTSFHTTDVAGLDPAWALLKARHLGPVDLAPRVKAAETYAFGTVTATPEAASASLLPPLLRAYLAMGGWVSDHAVIDRDLGTCHVFTCVDIDRLPPARRRVLEQMAAS
ncbi:MAG: GNAT family N-acyltransferase, partial [Pararhodobacter sp.]